VAENSLISIYKVVMSFVNSISATKTAQVMSKIDTTSSGVEIEGIYTKTQVDNKFVADQHVPLINPYIAPFTWNDIATQNFVNTRNFATLDDIYPVGSIYLTASAVSPSTSFGGSWIRYAEGKCLFGVDDNDSDFSSVEQIGGEKTHTLTKAEIPQHTHDYVDYHRGGGAGNEVGIWHNRYDITTNRTTADGYADGLRGEAHNNLPPYIAIYIWKRTA
jgi:hypothetical protein